MSVTPYYTEINVIGNYAPTAKATVTVMDGHNPVSDACVEFKLYNYAEFILWPGSRPMQRERFLTAGKGDMLVWASKDGKFGYAKLFGKDHELVVKMDKTASDLPCGRF